MKKCELLLFLLLNSLNLFSQENFADKIDAILQPYNKEHAPGLSIGVIKSENFIYNKGFGLANLEYCIQNSDTSKFDIGSIAKQFTAAGIWLLVEQNRLSLDDDVRQYLPELPFYGDTIRIRHMLNHTSGLRNYLSLLALAGIDHTKQFFNNQSVFELTCKQKGLNNVPGEKVLYGNTPFNLLTIIIERITEEKFSTFLQRGLFLPLGMKHTQVRDDNTNIVRNRSVGYVQNKELDYHQFPRIESCYGAGSLWSTVADLAIWTKLFNKKNTEYQNLVDFLLKKDTLISGELASYSRGIMIDSYKGKETVHHGGYTQGYRSQIISVPEMELSVIVLTNLQSINPIDLSYKILDLFLEENDDTKIPVTTYTHSKRELLTFTGQYQEANSDLKMEIIYENDTLKSKSSMGNFFTPLISKNKSTFIRLNQENVKYEFDHSSNYDLVIFFGSTPFYLEKASFIDPKKINYEDYTGEYFSEELNVQYSFFIQGDQLYLSYPNSFNIKLYPGQYDEFGNGQRTKYTFKRNAKQEVVYFTIASEGTVKDILFKKLME